MFKNVIKDLRKKTKLTQEELAKQFGVVPSLVSMWECGNRMPSDSILIAMSKYFNVSIDYLLLGEDMQKINNKKIEFTSTPNISMLPILGRVCAGNGIIAQEEIIGYSVADLKFIDGKHFYLQVKGESMEPFIANDSIVLVKNQLFLNNGDIGVFIVDDEGLIKKVKYDKDYIELISFNPYYPILRFDNEEVLRVKVIGKVIKNERYF